MSKKWFLCLLLAVTVITMLPLTLNLHRDVRADTNNPPRQPTNDLPFNGAAGVSPTPTLQSSAFYDPDGDTHAASQWQVTATSGNYSNSVFDSGTDAFNLTSIVVPSGSLSHLTTYYWHVRYQDNLGAWSEYSEETSFSTNASLSVTTNPATNVKPRSATLNGYLDSPGSGSYVHVLFQIGLSASYSSTGYAGKMTAAGPFSLDVSGLSRGTTYHYRVVAVSSNGKVVLGGDVTFCYTSPALTTRPATDKTFTSATLNGTVDSLGSAAYVDVCFIVGLTSSHSKVEYVGRFYSAGAVSYNLSELSAGTTYHYAVVLRDNNGVIVKGNDVTFTTSWP